MNPRFALAILLLILPASPAAAQEESTAGMLALQDRSDGERTMSAFEDAVVATRGSVLGIYAPPRRFIGLATVISANGLLLAKASEVVTLDAQPEDLQVRNARYRAGEVEIVALDLDNDLVLLRTGLDGLEPVEWADVDPHLGDWTYSYTNRLRAAASGVISANSREVSSMGAYLGVALRADPEAADKPLVTQVIPGSAADLGGVLAGDYLVGIDGRRIEDAQRLSQEIRQFVPGMVISLMVERGGTVYRTEVELGYRSSFERQQTSNAMIAGQVSERQNGFGRIHQHTTLLAPEMMGGPIFDLDGRCLGINIARVDRTTTYALPPDQIMLALERMRDQSEVAETVRAGLESAWRSFVEQREAERAAELAAERQALEEAGEAAEEGVADAEEEEVEPAGDEAEEATAADAQP